MSVSMAVAVEHAERRRVHDRAAEDLGQAPPEAEQDHRPETRRVVDANDQLQPLGNHLLHEQSVHGGGGMVSLDPRRDLGETGFSTSAGDASPSRTPPAACLWGRSGDWTLRATGKPMARAAATASGAVPASVSSVVSDPEPGQQLLDLVLAEHLGRRGAADRPRRPRTPLGPAPAARTRRPGRQGRPRPEPSAPGSSRRAGGAGAEPPCARRSARCSRTARPAWTRRG